MDGPVGSAEHRTVWWSGDMPAVFVDETVMKTAEKHQIVKVGGASIGPMLHVMNL